MVSSQIRVSIKKSPTLIILTAVTFLSIGLYLLASNEYYRIGFPLDDAWIHQTYARSLSQTGKWEFFPGQSSAGGSTSPLWSMLLAIGHFFKINYFFWSFLLGGFFLLGTAYLVEDTVRRVSPQYHPEIPWIGILFTLEWHFVWAALSGMETILQIFLTTLFFSILISQPEKYTLLGIIIGLSTWVRPDGLTLLLPLFLKITLTSSTLKNRLRNFLLSGLGFTLFAVPYLCFNLIVSGTSLPNTFYAKQAEYAALQSIPFIRRFFEQFLQPLTGIGLLLLPASIFYLYDTLQKKYWALASYYLWPVAYMAIYALRLPVNYQHGRYGMPVMPYLFLMGSIAGIEWMSNQKKRKKINFVLQQAWSFSIAIICLGFFFLGAWTYAKDVAFIESEMVETSRWIATNIPASKLIAAHDIGALGFFGSHQIIDLAGLISPEVIPIIRDEEKLAQFLDTNNVNFLVAFPNWYPKLIQGKRVIFSSKSTTSESYSIDKLTIYLWK